MQFWRKLCVVNITFDVMCVLAVWVHCRSGSRMGVPETGVEVRVLCARVLWPVFDALAFCVTFRWSMPAICYGGMVVIGTALRYKSDG